MSDVEGSYANLKCLITFLMHYKVGQDILDLTLCMISKIWIGIGHLKNILKYVRVKSFSVFVSHNQVSHLENKNCFEITP